MTRQLEVYENPLPRARRDYPFVVVLQSSVADTGKNRVVAPLALRENAPAPWAKRLVPAVRVGGRDYAVLIPRPAVIDTTILRQPVADLESYRDAVADALDLLYFGI